MNITIETADILATSQATRTLDTQLTEAAKHAAEIIGHLLRECAPTLHRHAFCPKLTQDDCGHGELAEWSGIRFAGGRKQRHTGQGSSTWQWSISGQSAYISEDGTVRLIDWDGKATDFGGTEGYMDTYTSEVSEDTLEDHLSLCPESIQEIVDALRKTVEKDKVGVANRLERITKIIAALK